jgi:hypothetical protein
MHQIPIRFNLKQFHLIIFTTAAILVTSCTPTIKVETPSEPITINLNVKIEHEIRVKVDKELDELFKTEDDLF